MLIIKDYKNLKRRENAKRKNERKIVILFNIQLRFIIISGPINIS